MNAKLKILCTGDKTIVELDGKTIGKGVNAIDFRHDGGENAEVKISIDLGKFSFMPDGQFDEFEKAIAKESPPEDQLNGRTG